MTTYSLQWGYGREQLRELTDRPGIVDLGDRLGDFQETAAIVANLDLVISCDSAPAHLAGANLMGMIDVRGHRLTTPAPQKPRRREKRFHPWWKFWARA